MPNEQIPIEIEGDRVNDLMDEAVELFKKHDINVTNDLGLTLELVKCLGEFLESKKLVSVVDEVHPYDEIMEILEQEENVCALQEETYH